MVESSGLILTTARNLGLSPVADYETGIGITGEAWVVGRDDRQDVALLRVISPRRGGFSSTRLSTAGAPQVDDEYAVLSYLPSPSTELDRRPARVVGVRQDFNTGIRYFQIQAVSHLGAEGGAVVDNSAELRGLRMTEEQMIDLGIGRPGEAYAIAADSLATLILPRLKQGLLVVLPRVTDAGDAPPVPPGLPSTFTGTVTVGGVPAPEGLQVYARVIREGKPDLWFSQPLLPGSQYVMPISVTVQGYEGATVEFWLDAQRAAQTAKYQAGREPTTLNLSFSVP